MRLSWNKDDVISVELCLNVELNESSNLSEHKRLMLTIVIKALDDCDDAMKELLKGIEEV